MSFLPCSTYPINSDRTHQHSNNNTTQCKKLLGSFKTGHTPYLGPVPPASCQLPAEFLASFVLQNTKV